MYYLQEELARANLSEFLEQARRARRGQAHTRARRRTRPGRIVRLGVAAAAWSGGERGEQRIRSGSRALARSEP